MNPQLYNALYGPESLNHRLFMAINHAAAPILDPIMTAMITLGGSRMVYPYAAILLSLSLVNRELMPKRYVVVYCLATALGIGLEVWLKTLVHIARPALAIGLDKVRVLGEVRLKNSFPSGHAIFSFMTAYVLSYRRTTAWKVPIFSFACLVAWSRVYVGAHYPLDVTAGAIVGIATGAIVWKGWEVVAVRVNGGSALEQKNGRRRP